MQTISKLFAEIGFKVNTEGLKEFQGQMKALSAGLKNQILDSKAQAAASKAAEAASKAATAEIKTNIASHQARKAAIQADTAELRKLEVQQRMESRAAREADAQRQRSIRGLRNFLLGITAASYAVTKLTQQTRQQVLAFRDFQFFTGMKLENLRHLEAMAVGVAPNLTGERIAGELTNLQQNLTNIEFGQGNIFPYQLLGISAATKDAITIVNGLRNAIKDLDNVRSVNLIERMGLSRDWLYVLKMSNDEFERTRATMLSTQQIQNLQNLSLAWNRLSVAFKNFKDQLTSAISEPLMVLINSLRRMLEDFSIFVKMRDEAGGFWDRMIRGAMELLTILKPLIAVFELIDDYLTAQRGGYSIYQWGTNNPNALIKPKEGEGVIARAIRGFIGGLLPSASGETLGGKNNMTLLPRESRSLWEQIKDFPSWLMDNSPFQFLRPSQPVINNNINMNGYTAQEGGDFIGSLNKNQSEEFNMTSSQLITIGSAG